MISNIVEISVLTLYVNENDTEMHIHALDRKDYRNGFKLGEHFTQIFAYNLILELYKKRVNL